MKRIIAAISVTILLALCAAVFTSCGSVTEEIEYAKIAQGKVSSDGFKYDLYENNTAEITGATVPGCFMTVPSTVDGYKVISIGNDAFINSTELVYLKISEGIQIIGDGAFEGCSTLAKVELPKSLRSIGSFSFASCMALYSVTGHEKLELIGDDAFYACTSLAKIELPKTLKRIGDLAFYGCTALGEVKLPDTKLELGVSTFGFCSSISYVSLGGITEIPSGMFEKCKSLSSIEIGDKITKIGDSAFRSCAALKNVTVSKKLSSIGYSVFEETPWLMESTDEFLVVGDGILLMYNGTQANVVIPKNVKKIADAFCANETITSVTIGNKVTEIGAFSFVGCPALSKVTVTADVTSVGESAFSGCTSLAVIYLPDTLESVGDSAFRSCLRLTSINYAGSSAKWSKITIENGNNSLVLGKINYSVKP